VAGKSRLVAATVRALVSPEGISGLRKAFTLFTVPVSCTWMTPGNRAIIPGAATGNSAVPPVMVWPFCTVSRLVPSLAISASNPAWEEADRPSTAVIAATPIAMPSADKPARSLRVRSPTAAKRAISAGRNRAAAGGGVAGGVGAATVVMRLLQVRAASARRAVRCCRQRPPGPCR
jgi:hypothetical protein